MDRTEVSNERVDAPTGERSLRARIGRGLRWSLTGLLATKMASFLISLVIARLLTVYFGTSHGGIRGTAMSHALVAMLIAVPLGVLMLERAGVHLSGVVPELARPAIAVALCAGVCIAATLAIGDEPWLELLVAGGAGLGVYVAVAVPAQMRQRILRSVRRGNPRQPLRLASSRGARGC
jgi:hypothetical protein